MGISIEEELSEFTSDQGKHDRKSSDFPRPHTGAHNVYYVKLPAKVLYFTIHIHTQINQYVVISDFPPVSFVRFIVHSLHIHVNHNSFHYLNSFHSINNPNKINATPVVNI